MGGERDPALSIFEHIERAGEFEDLLDRDPVAPYEKRQCQVGPNGWCRRDAGVAEVRGEQGDQQRRPGFAPGGFSELDRFGPFVLGQAEDAAPVFGGIGPVPEKRGPVGSGEGPHVLVQA